MLNIERPRAHQSSITIFFIHPAYHENLANERSCFKAFLTLSLQIAKPFEKLYCSDVSNSNMATFWQFDINNDWKSIYPQPFLTGLDSHYGSVIRYDHM